MLLYFFLCFIIIFTCFHNIASVVLFAAPSSSASPSPLSLHTKLQYLFTSHLFLFSLSEHHVVSGFSLLQLLLLSLLFFRPPSLFLHHPGIPNFNISLLSISSYFLYRSIMLWAAFHFIAFVVVFAVLPSSTPLPPSSTPTMAQYFSTFHLFLFSLSSCCGLLFISRRLTLLTRNRETKPLYYHRPTKGLQYITKLTYFLITNTFFSFLFFLTFLPPCLHLIPWRPCLQRTQNRRK